MGFFNRSIDERASQILQKSFGESIELEFAATGMLRLNSTPSAAEINPMISAVTSKGIFIMNNSEVVLVLPWKKILSSSPEVFFDSRGDDLILDLPNLAKVGVSKHLPFDSWHKATLRFSNSVDQARYREFFREMKIREGYTEGSLHLMSKWVEFDVNLLEPEAEFHKRNSHWLTAELRSAYLSKLSYFQDAQAFLYCIGRLTCAGKVSGELIPHALSKWEEHDKLTSEISGETYRMFEDQLELLDQTSKLPWQPEVSGQNSLSPDTWVVGRIETSAEEWQPSTPINSRLVAIHVIGPGQGHPSIRIWNDFHFGESRIVHNLNSVAFNQSIDVNGLKVSFSSTDIEKCLAIWTSSTN